MKLPRHIRAGEDVSAVHAYNYGMERACALSWRSRSAAGVMPLGPSAELQRLYIDMARHYGQMARLSYEGMLASLEHRRTLRG